MLNVTKTNLTFNWALSYNKTVAYKIFLYASPFQAYSIQQSMSKIDFKKFLKEYHRDVILRDDELSNRYIRFLVDLKIYQ